MKRTIIGPALIKQHSLTDKKGNKKQGYFSSEKFEPRSGKGISNVIPTLLNLSDTSHEAVVYHSQKLIIILDRM